MQVQQVLLALILQVARQEKTQALVAVVVPIVLEQVV
jgi:hypothetical protein